MTTADTLLRAFLAEIGATDYKVEIKNHFESIGMPTGEKKVIPTGKHTMTISWETEIPAKDRQLLIGASIHGGFVPSRPIRRNGARHSHTWLPR